MKLGIFLAGALVFSSISAHATDGWPSQFRVVCGDISHSVPYNGRDHFGTLVNPAIQGTATQVPANQLGGYWRGGQGYSILVTIQDSTITGTDEPVVTTLNCAFKGIEPNADFSTTIHTAMDCRSNLTALPTIPGFNMMKAALTVPTNIVFTPNQRTAGNLTTRYSESFNTPTSSATRYYTRNRELTCDYTLLSM